MKKPIAALAVLALCIGSVGASAQQKPDLVRTESVKPAAAAGADVRINLNKASVADLAKLPGVGEARARAIVKSRPYRSKDELLKKKVLPENVYEDIKANVYAGM